MIAAPNTTETNYLGEIEAAFNQARGAHKNLSAIDAQILIEWEQRGVPLHVVTSTIKTAFDRKHPRDRASINSLSFVKAAVEDAFKAWQTGQTGAHAPSELSKADVVAAPDAARTDDAAKVRAELEHRLAELRDFHAAQATAEIARPALLDTIAQLGKELKTLRAAKFNHHDFELIESLLVILDAKLTDSLKAHLTPDEHTELATNAAKTLDRFRFRWTKRDYSETFEAIFTHNVRRHFAAPRLTLFQ